LEHYFEPIGTSVQKPVSGRTQVETTPDKEDIAEALAGWTKLSDTRRESATANSFLLMLTRPSELDFFIIFFLLFPYGGKYSESFLMGILRRQ
jgi:hypothetical protein